MEAFVVTIAERAGKRVADRLPLGVPVALATGRLEQLSDCRLREALKDLSAEAARRGGITVLPGGGPAARRALSPPVVVAFIDANTKYVQLRSRRRRLVNGREITPDHARMVRRWRSGEAEGVTFSTAERLLARYGLTLEDLSAWARGSGQRAVLRSAVAIVGRIATGLASPYDPRRSPLGAVAAAPQAPARCGDVTRRADVTATRRQAGAPRIELLATLRCYVGAT
jgi:hypothetical protein